MYNAQYDGYFRLNWTNKLDVYLTYPITNPKDEKIHTYESSYRNLGIKNLIDIGQGFLLLLEKNGISGHISKINKVSELTREYEKSKKKQGDSLHDNILCIIQAVENSNGYNYFHKSISHISDRPIEVVLKHRNLPNGYINMDGDETIFLADKGLFESVNTIYLKEDGRDYIIWKFNP